MATSVTALPPNSQILRRLPAAGAHESDARVRVGFVTPNLVPGGAEHECHQRYARRAVSDISDYA